MKTCSKDDVPLFHITERENIKSISKEGLLTEKMDLESIIDLRYEFIHYDDPEYSMEDARDDVTPMIFATTQEGVDNISLLTTFIEDPVIIGIKEGDNCSYRFRQEEVASFEDIISVFDIPPECLCLVTDWK